MAWHQLKHLPVQTQSGVALGHVEGFVFDPEAHAIVQYEVRRGTPLARKTLLIATSQVVSISAEQMIVDDNVADAAAEEQRMPAAEPTATPLTAVRKG